MKNLMIPSGIEPATLPLVVPYAVSKRVLNIMRTYNNNNNNNNNNNIYLTAIGLSPGGSGFKHI